MDNNQDLDKNEQTPQVSNKKAFLVILLITILILVLFILSSAAFIPLVVGTILTIFIGREGVQSMELGGLIFVFWGFAIGGILYALLNGLIIYFLLKKRRFLFIGFFAFFLLYTLISTIVKLYSEYQTGQVSKEIENTVGKEPLILAYSSSTPLYDSDNYLQTLDVVFYVTPPETGEYKFDVTVGAPNDFNGTKPVSAPITTSHANKKVHLTKGVSEQIHLSFNMNDITSSDYKGELKLYFRIWRIDLNIKAAGNYKYSGDGKVIKNYPILVKDSGKSKNFIVPKENGVEEPVYTIGPFATVNPLVTITPSETISSFTPLANWQKFGTQELSFYYPGEWKLESSTSPSEHIRLSAQFHAPNAQIPRGEQILVFTKSTYPAIGHIKSIKEAGKFIMKTVNIKGKNATKLGEPGTTEFIIFPTTDGYIEFMSNTSHDLFYQILGTIKLNP